MHADWHVFAGKVEFITGVLRAHGARLTVEAHLRSQLHWASPVLATHSRMQRFAPLLHNKPTATLSPCVLCSATPTGRSNVAHLGVSLCSMLRLPHRSKPAESFRSRLHVFAAPPSSLNPKRRCLPH